MCAARSAYPSCLQGQWNAVVDEHDFPAGPAATMLAAGGFQKRFSATAGHAPEPARDV